MKRKLTLSELKISSFITSETIKAGDHIYTYPPYCTETDNPCDLPTDLCDGQSCDCSLPTGRICDRACTISIPINYC